MSEPTVGSNNTSGFVGVSFNKKTRKWKAQHRRRYLGLFNTREEAAAAYAAAVLRDALPDPTGYRNVCEQDGRFYAVVKSHGMPAKFGPYDSPEEARKMAVGWNALVYGDFANNSQYAGAAA